VGIVSTGFAAVLEKRGERCDGFDGGRGDDEGSEDDYIWRICGYALALMEEKKITSLMVVDERGKLEGIVHLHDLWSTEWCKEFGN